ncbi:D-alanyl-D-alanine carboxypeptidase/D-alanyl-D-alanine endopeptidase [Paracoccus aminophilus]|uniref:D-alanyl-D-alanine carboxypeptidase/D-alanyl-D-alanine-endopeptidase (Penicillin-binding protein 4) n=1 Tax=Paracoccus aminophilus JCM 7686 TaxID=1367847 RepID=S5XVN7_PARAH|nr:D-alanyl-D-alanine carboxypeptidase/D-alanyl-D-alanine-endopeptidase [Paracoccus aminophilus]AGT09342.1 D-alanyl-D-alanine carboxypeptidase/D-alanyl-D-alanine-endopeptidase (penicillin-binding protein 4) [Paracoccus aminophilus JCM 7686]
MSDLSRRSLLLGLLAAGSLPALALANPRPKARPATDGGTAAAAPARAATPLDPEALIAKAKLGAVVAYAALDPATGRLIDAREPDLPLAPASTLKAVTALYALARLGPDHRYRTRVIRAGDLLILAGGGDPELDTDGLGTLAKAAAAAEKAAGRPAPRRFAVWGGALPHVSEISPGQAVHLAYNPTISGIILNFNRVHLGWKRSDKGYTLAMEARGSRLSPPSYTISATVADRAQPIFTYSAAEGRENWTVAKSAMGKDGSRWLPVRNPELYAADVFQTLCRAEGLNLPAAEIITDLPPGEEIASRSSAPLQELLVRMMEYSNNLTAEIVGLSASRQPSLRTSAAEMESWLRGQGISGPFSFRDHSGLAPDNRVTARMMAEMAAGPGRAQGLQVLMKHIALRDAEGKPVKASPVRVDAKTGTLNFVSNLAGYAQQGAGPQICFAILTGDESRRAATEGRERPEGVLNWTRRSKALQQGLIEHWLAGAGRTAPGSAPISEQAVAGAG